jgi:pyruvate formate lyase activating enzyme
MPQDSRKWSEDNGVTMECANCKKESPLITEILGVCIECIREDFEKVLPLIKKAHQVSRSNFSLPEEVPRDKRGVKCNICVNECQIPEGGFGYCGLRTNHPGKLVHLVSRRRGNLTWYHDPLPTNCVAEWVCGERKSYGYKNLAVFYHGCSFDCLFCQNWHYREEVECIMKGATPALLGNREGLKSGDFVTSEELSKCVDGGTNCICYFGGDPIPQIYHALETSRLALEKKGVRICWETNGCMNPKFLKEMAELSLDSGGCIKFDLKAFSEELNIALCGVTNRRTLENFSLLAEYVKKRKEPPFLVASTLLVPGYVDRVEVSKIARFIASLDSEIPYSLLAFHPHFHMSDLPTTSRRHAKECLEEVRRAGLERVKIGNIHLLSDAY